MSASQAGAERGDKPLVVLLLTTETNVTVLCAKAVEAATRAAGRMVEGRIFAGWGGIVEGVVVGVGSGDVVLGAACTSVRAAV